jgi:ABC-2 type transport system ATP-binding protein
MWFVYEQAFAFADLYADMGERKRKIKADAIALEIQMNGRSITEPMNLDGQNKLILRNFSKKYATSNVYAVKDANLEVVGGEIFGFLGPNGAGKSTIIKSIVGIQTITSGSIEVCGYDVEKQPVGAKMQLGFVPDHYALYENLTGREYVNYIADLYGVSVEDRTARIDEYVERFNLTHAFDNKIKTYSHGMKQKITIMSALVHEPKVWILDEPLTGLDPESIWQVKECMKAHAKKGNIVFFSSHIIDVVERICDRIAIIKKGNILCTRTIKEIEESGEKLENYYMDMIGEQRRDDSEYDKTNLEGAEG